MYQDNENTVDEDTGVGQDIGWHRYQFRFRNRYGQGYGGTTKYYVGIEMQSVPWNMTLPASSRAPSSAVSSFSSSCIMQHHQLRQRHRHHQRARTTTFLSPTGWFCLGFCDVFVQWRARGADPEQRHREGGEPSGARGCFLLVETTCLVHVGTAVCAEEQRQNRATQPKHPNQRVHTLLSPRAGTSSACLILCKGCSVISAVPLPHPFVGEHVWRVEETLAPHRDQSRVATPYLSAVRQHVQQPPMTPTRLLTELLKFTPHKSLVKQEKPARRRQESST